MALSKDQWYLKSQEVQNLLVEVSKIVRGDITVDDTQIIRKYWNRPSTNKTPKLFTLHGDDETAMALLGTFNNLKMPLPAPGSIFAVDFYSCVEQCDYKLDDHVKVEVSYCPNGLDIEDSCTLLEYDAEIQDVVTTSTSAEQFEKYLVNSMLDNEYYGGYGEAPLLKNICAFGNF